MAYTNEADVRIAAGGQDNLVELADHDGDGAIDAEVLARAQAEADTLIDGYSWKLYSKLLPWNPVPQQVRNIAAKETVYVLKGYRNNISDKDETLRGGHPGAPPGWIDDLAAFGRGERNWVPGDTYPRADGGGAPICVTSTEAEDAFKGFC